MPEQAINLLVKRDDLRTRRMAQTALPELADGQALLRVDCFALTANTVTYAVFGEGMQYWNFFPTSETGWGRVPCWGHGDVIASRAAGVPEGARYYGYYPIGTHLIVDANARGDGFTDAAPHRQKLPSIYNSYLRAEGDADAQAMAMLFRPLYGTSWLIDDFLAGENFFGATRVIVSSASSKTAIGLAHLLTRRAGITAVGLTSPSHVAFVRGLGLWDEVLAYDAIGTLDSARSVYVDLSGATAVRRQVHEHLRDALIYDCAVGAADWSAAGPPPSDLPGVAPAFFFAPTQREKRVAETGAAAFAARFTADARAFDEDARRWMRIVRAAGADAVDAGWEAAVEGRQKPDEGMILRL